MKNQSIEEDRTPILQPLSENLKEIPTDIVSMKENSIDVDHLVKFACRNVNVDGSEGKFEMVNQNPKLSCLQIIGLKWKEVN